MPPSPTTVSISSDALTAEISTDGAELQRLIDAMGHDLQWNGDPAVWKGRAPILFPVIGLLVGGAYRYDGVTYEMPKHGFARHSRFDIAAQSPTSVTFRLAANPQTRAIYPFGFQLDIVFEVTGSTLRLSAAISNLGDRPMPASLGFHPALRWPLPFGAARADHRILFPHAEPAPVRRIDADGFLKPEAQPSPVDGRELRLRDGLFVDDALIFDRLTSRSVRYGAPAGPQLEVAFEDFPTLGVWTKPGAEFICIEPWQGFSDPEGFAGDIRDKPGIVEIASGATRCLAMSLSLIGAPSDHSNE